MRDEGQQMRVCAFIFLDLNALMLFHRFVLRITCTKEGIQSTGIIDLALLEAVFLRTLSSRDFAPLH